MNNENRPTQPEAEQPRELIECYPKDSLELGLRMESGQFTSAEFQPNQPPLPEEKIEKILRADTRRRQIEVLKKSTQDYDKETHDWTVDLIEKINKVKRKNNPEQLATLKKIFGEDIEQDLGIFDKDDPEEEHKKITKRSVELADKFRLKYFDHDGRELKDGNFITYLRDDVYAGTDLVAAIQRDFELLQTFTDKLYGSDLRFLRFALTITESNGSQAAKDYIASRKERGNFDITEKLNDLQKHKLAGLGEAQKQLDTQEARPTPEISSNTKKALDIAANIISQQKQDIFLRHFFTPEQTILLEGDTTMQLNTWFLSHFGRHLTTKEHEMYITNGQFVKELSEIQQELLSTTEYQDKAITRENVLYLFKTATGLEPPNIPYEVFSQYFYAVNMLGTPVYDDELKLRIQESVLAIHKAKYEQEVKDIEKKCKEEITKVEENKLLRRVANRLLSTENEDKIKAIKKKADDDIEEAKKTLEEKQNRINDRKEDTSQSENKRKSIRRKAIHESLKGLYDGEAPLALTEKLLSLPTLPEDAPEEEIIVAARTAITTNPEFHEFKQTFEARQGEIQTNQQNLDQMLGVDNDPISLSRKRKVKDALSHQDFSQAIANRASIPELKTKRFDNGNIIFAYDPNLPDVEKQLEEFQAIAVKRASVLNQHQRDRQPIVVLILSDQHVLESQTSSDGNAILFHYGDTDPLQARRSDLRRGDMAHEITHAIINQQKGQTPAFAINEAMADNASEDFSTRETYAQRQAGYPFRQNVTESEKEGYILAGFLYDLIRKYAANPQQAAQIFTAVAYNEAARWNLTMDKATLLVQEGKFIEADRKIEATNLYLIKNGIPEKEGPHYKLKGIDQKKKKETTIEETPLITNLQLIQHVYNMLGRDFNRYFMDKENKDLMDYIHNQKLVRETDANEKMVLLQKAISQPINFAHPLPEKTEGVA